MRIVRTRRFKAKDGTFILAGIVEQVTKLEDLPDTEQVVILARRDLVQFQRLLAILERKQELNDDQLALQRKVVRTLDSLTKS